MRFTLYPIALLSGDLGEEPFDLSRLPFDITENARIEAVSQRLKEGAFNLWKDMISANALKALQATRYAIVHRYDPSPTFDLATHSLISEQHHTERSHELTLSMAACLRLIRPMRQRALLIEGDIRNSDGSFDVTGFDEPPNNFIEVPESQKLFKLRDRDIDALKTYAPEFLRAMRGKFWKFRMSVQFHERGYFQQLDWKARYLLWCSAIESIYTSHNREHKGSLVARARINWFLGKDTCIYEASDIPGLLEVPHLTIGQVVGDLYEMRNFIAHGDRIPDSFFNEVVRHAFSDPILKPEMLTEAASFIIRTSLLKILRENLLSDFAAASSAEAYFAARKLTHSALLAGHP